jgi:ribosomal protein L44E
MLGLTQSDFEKARESVMAEIQRLVKALEGVGVQTQPAPARRKKKSGSD